MSSRRHRRRQEQQGAGSIGRQAEGGGLGQVHRPNELGRRSGDSGRREEAREKSRSVAAAAVAARAGGTAAAARVDGHGRRHVLQHSGGVLGLYEFEKNVNIIMHKCKIKVIIGKKRRESRKMVMSGFEHRSGFSFSFNPISRLQRAFDDM